MKTRLLPVALAGLAIVAIAGCGRSDDDDAVAATPTPAETAAPTTNAAPPPTSTEAYGAAGAELSAKVGDSDLGAIMTSADGLTLYGFVKDSDATSTCYSACADAWPPVIVDADWAVGPGLDTGVFSTTERDDGTLQLVAGKFPLYTYVGDAAPGDTTGQGSGDVWFAMNLDGTLNDGAASAAAPETTEAAAPETTVAEATVAPAPVTTATTSLGDVMVDEGGLTLYGFMKDANGTPTCVDGCAEAWPPVIVDDAELPAGLDPAVFTVVQRPDGTNQLEAGTWPLYRFAGDEAPGDTNGQGSGEVWFVVDPAGKLIK